MREERTVMSCAKEALAPVLNPLNSGSSFADLQATTPSPDVYVRFQEFNIKVKSKISEILALR